MNCPTCKSQMKNLFYYDSFYCPNECESKVNKKHKFEDLDRGLDIYLATFIFEESLKDVRAMDALSKRPVKPGHIPDNGRGVLYTADSKQTLTSLPHYNGQAIVKLEVEPSARFSRIGTTIVLIAGSKIHRETII